MPAHFLGGCESGGREQCFFKCIELVKTKRVEIYGEIPLQKPAIEKSGLLFVFQIRTDNFVKEFTVFSVDEKVKFVTGIGSVFFNLFLLFQFGPIHEESKLPHDRIFIDGQEKIIGILEGIDGTKPGSGEIFDFETFFGFQNGDLFLFRVGGLEIQVGHHASFLSQGFRIRERQIETDLLDGVKGEKPKHSVALVPGNVDNDDPILIRPEIFEEKGTMF